MRLFTVAAAFLAPICALAGVAFTNSAYDGIAVGSPFTLTWSGDATPVMIKLLTGPKDLLMEVDTVASSAEGSSYTWTPLSTLKAGQYALSIAQSGATNYSPQFQLANNDAQSTTASSTASTSEPATSVTTALSNSYTSEPATSTTTTVATPTAVADLAVRPSVHSPPYPTGPGNSNNSTAPAATRSSIGAAVPLASDGPRAAGTPSGSLAPFVGGAEKIGEWGLPITVGVLILGALAVRWAS